MKHPTLHGDKEPNPHNEEYEEKEEDEVWERNPSLSEMIELGVPPDYLVILFISLCICVAVTVKFTRVVNEHRAYSTKYTMQCLCTIGVVFTFPVFVIMFFSGMIVPKAMSKVTYIAETYESVSLLFFLRLLLTYLGGKKETREKLTHEKVRLNSPPICCLTFLPKIPFTKRFLFINEIFIAQLVVFQLVFGYIDLLIGLDESHSHPTDLIEHEYSQVYHICIIFSLLLAVYGLGGIYHTAEDHLKHYKIYRKFILYKAFVTVVKLEEFLLSYVVTNLVKKYGIDLNYGAFRADLRVHMWCYFLIEVEAFLTFPFLIRAYSTADYPGGVKERDVECVALGTAPAIVGKDEEGTMRTTPEKVESRKAMILTNRNTTKGNNVGYNADLENIVEEGSDDEINLDDENGLAVSSEEQSVTVDKEEDTFTPNEETGSIKSEEEAASITLEIEVDRVTLEKEADTLNLEKEVGSIMPDKEASNLKPKNETKNLTA